LFDMTGKARTSNFLKCIFAILATFFISLLGATSSRAQVSGQCMASSGSWVSTPLSYEQNGSFEVTFDAVPSQTVMDAVTGLTDNPNPSTYTDLAAAVRFNNLGFIDARNGGEFDAVNAVAYAPRVTYHFIMDVNVPQHSYNLSVQVNGTTTQIANGFSFRTEQAYTTALGTMGELAFQGMLAVCNIQFGSAPVTGTPGLTADSSSLQFGSVKVSSTGTQTVTLTNNGSASVTIENIFVSGAGFDCQGSVAGTTLAPSQSVGVRAWFTPAASGTFSGILTITSNAANSPAITIALSGTGGGTSSNSQPASSSSSHTVTLSWNPSSGAVGYNLYVSSTSGGPYTIVNSGLIGGTSYTDSSASSGQTLYFVATAVNAANQESGYSAETSAVVP
jgi:centrosomal CEP192-like protein